MYFLQSCRIIYEDLSVRTVDECDGLMSIFTMPNVSGMDIIILLAIILITVYFILKTILLFKNNRENN